MALHQQTLSHKLAARHALPPGSCGSRKFPDHQEISAASPFPKEQGFLSSLHPFLAITLTPDSYSLFSLRVIRSWDYSVLFPAMKIFPG
jgi:hypothetical protein